MHVTHFTHVKPLSVWSLLSFSPAKETVQNLIKESVQKTPAEVYPNIAPAFLKFSFQEFPEA